MNPTSATSIELDAPDYTILIVDDNPTNLGVIVSYLEDQGFRILVAQDGEAALKSARQARPDLILLDVMMPGVDGFETCRRLKTDQATQDIAVIFMTALSETEAKIKGFQAGGVDYITKPIQQEEVLARVMTHLKLRSLTDRLQERNEALSKLNADKDKFFAIVSHDLRSPFNGLLSNTEFLLEMVEPLNQADILDVAQDIRYGVKAIYNLLENLLTWSKMQRAGGMQCQPTRLELLLLAQETVEVLRQTAAQKNIQLKNSIPPDLYIQADHQMISMVIRNLVSNALKFTPDGGTVTLAAQSAPPNSDIAAVRPVELVSISVKDTGVGIKPEDMARLFRIDVHHSTPGTHQEEGAGLGLIICQEMVERNGGTISITSLPGQGTTIEFTVPQALPVRASP